MNVLLSMLVVGFFCSSMCARKQLIFGGKKAELGMFPYMVYVRRDTVICTGALISPNWVLTAGHCICGKNIEVAAGIVNGLSPTVNFKPAIRAIAHPKFLMCKPAFGNDVALIEIDAFDMTNKNIGILKLDNRRWSGKSVSCTAAGFGITTPDGSRHSELLYINVRARHGPGVCECSKIFQHFNRTLICLSADPHAGLCPGDSGGPLLCGGKGVGVAHIMYEGDCVTFPALCDKPSVISAYMFICPFLDWIREYVKDVPQQPADCGPLLFRYSSESSKAKDSIHIPHKTFIITFTAVFYFLIN